MTAATVVWAFDVDGCIVDSLSATSLRPHAAAVLEAVRDSGATVLLWSAGGREHAELVSHRHRLHHLFDAIYDKGELDDSGRLTAEHLPVHHRPHVVVDDRPEEAPIGTRVVAVRPYTGHDPADRGLTAVLDELGQPGRLL